MTFSVRKTIDDTTLDPFEYEDADGAIQQLPHAKTLSAEQAVRVMLEGDIEGVVDEVAPGQGGAIMRLPSFVAEALLKAWFDHSDVDLSGLGKPARPSRSTPSTGTRSKRTSRSGGSRSTR